MAENFKKHKGGPTPVLPKGSQEWGGKTIGTSPTHHPHAQDPHQKKRPAQHRDSGNQDKFSPPVVPHHTTNPDWNYPSGHPLRIQPTLGPLVKPWAPMNHPMMSGQGGQNRPQGSRYARGGEGVRPNVEGQSAPASVRSTSQRGTHMMVGPQRPRMKVGMTKKIHGLIGKGKKKVHRSPY